MIKKVLLLFLCAFCFFSCSSTKKTIVKSHKQQNDTIVTVTKVPIEIKKEPKKDVVLKEEPQNVPQQTKIVAVGFNHDSWNSLLEKHVSNSGNSNYKGFKKDRVQLQKYLDALSNNLPTEEWSKTEKLAYWMNAYNAFTIKLILDNYPIKSIKNIKNPWKKRFFKLGKKWYNLNDIEHQILRKMDDPRIHFGINCASFSCPPLANKAFTAINVDQLLEQLTSAFINDNKRNEISKNSIKISKIFQWFAKDFKNKGSLIAFLNNYANIEIDNNAKKQYKVYDWRLNE